MTFQEAQATACKYDFLRGQPNQAGSSLISCIIICKEGNNHRPYAFYYSSGSQPGQDPVELYSYRLPKRLRIGINFDLNQLTGFEVLQVSNNAMLEEMVTKSAGYPGMSLIAYYAAFKRPHEFTEQHRNKTKMACIAEVLALFLKQKITVDDLSLLTIGFNKTKPYAASMFALAYDKLILGSAELKVWQQEIRFTFTPTLDALHTFRVEPFSA